MTIVGFRSSAKFFFHYLTTSPVRVSSSSPLHNTTWAKSCLFFLGSLMVYQDFFMANWNYSQVFVYATTTASATTKSIIDLSPKVFWYQVHFRTTNACLNMAFVTSSLCLTPRYKAALGFRPARLFLPVTCLQVSQSLHLWVLKSPNRTMESPVKVFPGQSLRRLEQTSFTTFFSEICSCMQPLSGSLVPDPGMCYLTSWYCSNSCTTSDSFQNREMTSRIPTSSLQSLGSACL